MNDTNVSIEKALKCYDNLRKSQKKYCNTENGKIKRREATKNYYEKKKVEDPEFMRKMADKAKLRYQKKKDKLIMLEFPDQNINKI